MDTVKLNYCNDCSDRSVCKVLCSTAEKYINQDYVPQREKTISELTNNNYEYSQMLDNTTIPWNTDNNYTYEQYKEICNMWKLTDKQAIILYKHMCLGNSNVRTANELGVSRQYIYKVLNVISNKLDMITTGLRETVSRG